MTRRTLCFFAFAAICAAQQPDAIAEFNVGEPVVQVMISPDARVLIAATSRTHAVQYDIATKHELRRYEVPEEVHSATFSSDGSLLAVGTARGGYRVWEVHSGKVIAEAPGDGGTVTQLAISPDNQRVALVQRPAAVRIVDLRNGKTMGPFAPPFGDPWAIAFSPDGTSVVTADDDTVVHVWDATSGRLLRQYDDSLLAPFALCFSHDGKLLAKGGAARTVDVVNLTSGKITHSLPVGRFAVRAITLSPSARYAAVQTMDPNGMSMDSPLQVWDVRAGKKITEFNATRGSAVAFKDESTLLASDVKDKTATVVAIKLPK
jgi:DNA-binding beta-propeller fold protein YncE